MKDLKTQRSLGGLRTSQVVIPKDGPTSLLGIKQYKNFEDIYQAFGETYPSDVTKDIRSRIATFDKILKENDSE